MRRLLTLHPSQTTQVVAQIAVDVLRPQPDQLSLRYCVSGATADILWPLQKGGERRDDLWRTTCFEAFIKVGAADAYCEFNFSPSTQWAAYRFSAFRALEDATPPAIAPVITSERTPSLYVMDVSLDLHVWPELNAAADWRFALSAVIEDQSGAISYWALAHPEKAPDFHHDVCFDLTFPGGTHA